MEGGQPGHLVKEQEEGGEDSMVTNPTSREVENMCTALSNTEPLVSTCAFKITQLKTVTKKMS